jgi:ABC-type Fe3+ transport system substrate-binding protein
VRVGRRYRLIALALIIVGALATIASGTAATSSNTRATAWADIVAAAQNEGPANLMTTEVPAWQAAEQALYNKATGLKFTVTASGANGTLETRLSAEEAAGSVQEDVYEDVGPSFFYAHPSWFVDLSTVGLPNLPGYPKDHVYKNLCIDDKLDLSGVTLNTNLVPPSHYPKKWTDLLDPYWKDKIVLSNPAPGGYYMQWALIMKKAFGLKFLNGIKAQNPSLQNSSVAAAQDVASGAKALSVLSQIDSGAALQAQGAPLKWLLLRNPDVGSLACVGILKNGPHPNAARVLLNYLMTKESQGGACQAGVPNISPLNATGCWPVPKTFVFPQVNAATGLYPGINNKNLRYRVLHALGL